MNCNCALVRFESDVLYKLLGRVWDLGPVEVIQDPDLTEILIVCSNDVIEKSLVSLQEFKQAVLSVGIEVPFTVKFVTEIDTNPYNFGLISFDDSVLCRYKSTTFSGSDVILQMELLSKGKELCIFNGISSNANGQREQKPLFWASILKGDLH